MSKIVAILLFLCLSCQCVLKLSIYTWFELNKEYIAATLCENRDRPELVCCGKCVLTRHLAKADGIEKNNPKQHSAKPDKTEITSFILPASVDTAPSILPESLSPRNGIVKDLPCTVFQDSVFHPPAA